MTGLHLSRLVFLRPPRDAYQLHQTLWGGFPEGARAFLFRADRLDDDDSDARLRVLVQSVQEPAWSSIRPLLELVEQKVKVWQFAKGDRLRFLLRANPTVRRKGSHDPATKDLAGAAYRAVAGHRVPVRDDDARADWLRRKAEAGGFGVDAVRLQNSTTTLWSKGSARGKHEGVDFEGMLVVREPDLFYQTLTAGIGTAKAFGYGLLSLAKPERW